MKVTVTLTEQEVKTLIAKQLNLVVADFTLVQVNSIAEGLDKIANFVKTLQKIAAIKCLREYVAAEGGYMGLADAKYAVEDFTNYRIACEKDGKFILLWGNRW